MNSMNSTPIPGTVHFNLSYINYEFKWDQFPTAFAIIPWFYMIPTLLTIFVIFNVYWKSNWKKSEPGKNQHVFLIISLSQFTCFALFLSDFLMTRLPSTGLFTSWCASVAPNHYLKIILFSAVYFNYLAMYFPFLMPVIRLIILTFPFTHEKINRKLVKFGIPLLIILPISFTFYLVPALGVCRQRGSPYPFGAIWIMFILYYGTSSYFSYTEIIRPFGNDLQFCVVTWVFYLTHPSFRRDPDDLDSPMSWIRRRFNISV